MNENRNREDLLLGALICAAEVLIPAVITAVNFGLLR